MLRGVRRRGGGGGRFNDECDLHVVEAVIAHAARDVERAGSELRRSHERVRKDAPADERARVLRGGKSDSWAASRGAAGHGARA